MPPSAVGTVLVILFELAVRAFQEETLFRGFLQAAFENRFGPRTANVLQALAFSIAHIGYIPTPEWPLYVLAFALGIVFGGVRMRRGRLLSPASHTESVRDTSLRTFYSESVVWPIRRNSLSG